MNRTLVYTATAALCLSLWGCGGGSSSPDTSDLIPSGSTTLNGTAAGGLPLVGTLTVMDAEHRTRTTAIQADANGHYSVDVSGMTAPFLLRAQGEVGLSRLVIHSAATAADIGGTINITPFTDLIIANVAGRVVSDYFERSDSSLSGFTADALRSEEAKLREKLTNVLKDLGVEGALDLLRTPFTPLKDNLDKALDVIRVNYDTASNIATITNVLNAQTLADDLAVKAADEPNPPVFNPIGEAVAPAADIDQIRQTLADYSALFAHALPSIEALKAMMTPDYKEDGRNRDQSASDSASYSYNLGMKLTDLVINRMDYTDPEHPIADVNFSLRNPQGGVTWFSSHYLFKKIGAKWLLHGNQRVLDITSEPFAIQEQTWAQGENISCKHSGIGFDISDEGDPAAAEIVYAIVTGPGLPASGLRYDRNRFGGTWMPHQPSDAWGELRFFSSTCDVPYTLLSDEEIRAIPSNTEYTIVGFDSSNNARFRYPFVHLARPMTRAELATQVFPSLQSMSINEFANFDFGNTVSLSFSGLLHNAPGYVRLYVHGANGASLENSEDFYASASGAASTYFAWANVPANQTQKQLLIHSFEESQRRISTYYNVSR